MKTMNRRKKKTFVIYNQDASHHILINYTQKVTGKRRPIFSDE